MVVHNSKNNNKSKLITRVRKNKMCQFMSSLPSFSKDIDSPQRKNLSIFIKPSAEKEYYRFRLLAFKNASKNDRSFPFIERYRHIHWGKTAEGKSHIDGEVICPVTRFVKWEGNRYDCPICKFAQSNFISFKESGWKDKESGRKNHEFGRKFEAIVPVFVVNDPNYPQNNNKFRVITFSDKDFYKQFKNVLTATSHVCNVFNGAKAVDFYAHASKVERVINEGLPNEYKFSEVKIDKFGFTKVEKAYEIPAINKEAIDQFPFDETYYISSSEEEIQEYYDKFIKMNNTDDIPDEDVNVFDKAKTSTVKKTNKVDESLGLENDKAITPPQISDDDISDDIDSTPNKAHTETKLEQASVKSDDEPMSTDDIDVDDLLNDLDV